MSDDGHKRVSGPPHRPLGPTFYRYFAAEALRPTLFALLGLTTVVLTKDLLGFSDLVINRGISGSLVAKIALYKAIPITALMFPFSVLLGCLVAMGRLGADREILTLEASGVAAARLVLPVVVFAAAMTLLSIGLSAFATPWASRSLDTAFETISREKPWARVRAGSVTKFGGWRLDAVEVSSEGNDLESVLLWIPDIGETVFARSARIGATETGSIEIELRDGSVVLPASSGVNYLRFESMTTLLPDSDKEVERDEEEHLKGLGFAELDKRALAFIRTKDDPLPHAAIEFQRRIAMPAATLVFGFLAAPMFLMRGNFSRASGGLMGLLLTIAYYGLVQLGEGLIQSEQVTVPMGVWMPNGLLMLLASVFLVRVLRGNVLGHSFDRPQLSNRKNAQMNLSTDYRPRRYPLPRYIVGRFLQLAMLTFAVLVVAYLLIDVMERLDWFARYEASGLDVLRFYGARLPLLASRVVPMSVLVATALTVSLLAVEGELIGMRSCGIAAPRALLPVLICALLVVPAFFTLNNVVVPRTNALADELKRTEIKGKGKVVSTETAETSEAASTQAKESRAKAVWHRTRNRVLEADRFDPEQGVARELSIYYLGDDGLPTQRVDAESAHHIGSGNWRLVDSSVIELSSEGVRLAESPGYATLGLKKPAKVDTMHLSVEALRERIAEVEADGHDATAYRVDFQVKLAQPFACIILPALMLFFAVGGPPFPGPAQNLLVSGVVGVSYILLSGVSASFGYGQTVSPVIGGWGPNIVFSLVAGFLGLRLLRRM
jgi:LPS export ABC transporter permease LptG/LPS export ABC transporter permease LptF